MGENWQELGDSNPRPSVLETDALPTELNSCSGGVIRQVGGKIKAGNFGGITRVTRVMVLIFMDIVVFVKVLAAI